jgi:hypothetical protein
MTTFIRWLLVAVVVAGGCLVTVPDAAAQPRPVLDGLHLGYLPRGLGTSTDFDYEFDEVRFAARVWESGSDSTGWRVDLHVSVLRGTRLTASRALHDWFIGYEDRPPGEARYVPVRVRGRPGWVARDAVFWLLRPGLAVAVRLDRARWSHRELMRVARSARLARIR